MADPTAEWHGRNPEEYSKGWNYPDLLPWSSNYPPASTTEIATPVRITSFSGEKLLELSTPMNTSPESRSTAQPFGLVSPMHTPTQDLEYICEEHQAALCDIEKERELRQEIEAMLQRQTELHRQSTLEYEHKLQQARRYLEAQQAMYRAFERELLKAKSFQNKRKTTRQVIEAEHEQLKKEHEELKIAYQELQNAHQELQKPIQALQE